MVDKLKESEDKLEKLVVDKRDDDKVASIEAIDTNVAIDEALAIISPKETHEHLFSPPPPLLPLKKVNNEDSDQTNKNLLNSVVNVNEDAIASASPTNVAEVAITELKKHPTLDHLENITEIKEDLDNGKGLEIKEIETLPLSPTEELTAPGNLNDVLRQNILSCIEKAAMIEEIKQKNSASDSEIQVLVCDVMTCCVETAFIPWHASHAN